MVANNFFGAFSKYGLFVLFLSTYLAHPTAYSNKPSAVNSHDGGSFVTPQLNSNNTKEHKHRLFGNQYEQKLQEQKYPDQQSNFTSFTSSKTGSYLASTSSAFSSPTSTKPLSDGISKSSSNPSLQGAFVYKAVIPTHFEPGLNNAVNEFKFSNATTPITNAINNFNVSMEKDNELSKKIIGSSVVTSVSVILNGNEPEFTDALGKKVAKPQPSLQVASPIYLLNPDRYEFYTFDEHGELMKRLMTMEEIQSIVANGDGEGPTIIHHGPIEDRDPEKNVQDIVDSVQSVLNKEVEYNKNTSIENIPVFDTPDVSSSWSMILPAIFGNTGSVDVFSHQKPQQIVMTPDSEIIETSTKKVLSSTTRKSKPGKRKPGQKRKSSTTTTEETPQVIQEELDSQESVYTGMQQYQNLAATMQNYDSISQLHMQPIYHKLPEIEATTRRIFINNQEVVKKPISSLENKNLAKKPISVQNKTLPQNHSKKPNGNHSTTKRPHVIKQKIKKKPTVTTTAPIQLPPTTSATTTTSLPALTTIITPPVTTTSAPLTTTSAEPTSTTTIEPITTTSTLMPSTALLTTSTTTSTFDSTTTTKSPKKKKKKPTRYPVHSLTTIPDGMVHKPHLIAEKRKPSPKPHRHRPRPTQQHTKYPHTTLTTDLTAEETAHQDISNNKFQHVLHEKIRPKPNKPNHNISTTAVPSTTVLFAPFPTPATYNQVNASLIINDFPGYQKTGQASKESLPPTLSSTDKYEETSSTDSPSTSGTSGYPVPSYDTPTEKPGSFDANQFNKHSSFTVNNTQNENKPYQQDVHTLQSFDQILQTLKYPTQTSDQLNVNMNQAPEKLIFKPIKYDSAEKLISSTTSIPFEVETLPSTLTDFVTTSNLLYQENAAFKDKSDEIYNKTTLRPNSNFITDPPEDITTNNSIEEDTSFKTETTDFPGFTSQYPEKLFEQNKEYENHLKKSETQHSPTPFTATNHPTLKNGYEASTQRYTEGLKEETVLFPHKDKKYTSHQIFVANLKPQLNMEVVQPSEQINMSDFQTQAATVASTLIDSANSLSSDYNNDTNDEIALLLSDVIHQISSNNEESIKQVTNFNDNRFSNQAQLDLSFFTSPIKEKNGIVTTTDNKIADKTSNDPNYKPVFERIENAETKPLEIRNENKDLGSFFGTTEIPETTTFRETENHEFYTESDKKIDDQQTTETDVIMYITESYTELNGQFSLQELENSTNFEIISELDEEPTTINNPILTSTVTYSPHHKLEEDREPLFESDSSLDTTTQVNGFLKEETTSFSDEKSLNGVNEQDTQNEDGVTLFESNTAKSSETDLTTEMIKDIFNSSEQITTTPGTSAGKLDLYNAESETSTVKTTEIPDWTTTISKNTLSSETQHLQIDVTKMESYRIPSDHTTESLKEEGLTIKSTTPEKEKKEEYTVKHIESNEYTTAMYQMSEETSAELNAMISEEDETDDSIDEDPYIKLGETTTLTSIEVKTQSILAQTTKQDVSMLAPTKSIQTIPEREVLTTTESSLPVKNNDETFGEADEEDEDDQIGYMSKQPKPFFSTTPNPIVIAETTKMTTTLKPKVITTRRLNTLKPVSYFNKKPAYILYQEPLEPLYDKNSPQSANTPPKFVTYTIPSSQQRPMQRPPQLSNLMISSIQSTRPPIKLEPSPFNSKGLEASLENLDEDILSFSKLCNELAFSYWKSITAEKISSARSLVMSPFALTSMLSMVFLGARGSTSGEMNDVLKLDDMVTFNPHLVFKNITDSVEKSTDSEIATSAFVREIYSDRANGKVLQFFKEKTQQLYAGHVEEVNFHVVNDIIRRRTNLLIKRHTMGKVLEYLRTNSVWVNGPLATISANLFQTDCSQGSIQDRDGEIFFQVHPTVRQRRLVPIPAVLFKNGFTAGYEPNLDATVVAFGRTQDTTSMIYVMPGHVSSISPSDNLYRLEKQLMETAISENIWSNLLTSLMHRPGMEVQIPRFSHRSFVNATTGLKKMGLKGLFKSDYADLGGLTGSSNRDIYLSDMIQINTFSTCGEEKIADHHHVEMYPAPPLRKRNKDVDALDDDEQDSSEAVIDFGSIVQESVIGRGFYDDLLDPKYLELPLPLRPRQARVPEAPRLRFDKPFLYFVRHNPTGMILFMGRFNPRLLP